MNKAPRNIILFIKRLKRKEKKRKENYPIGTRHPLSAHPLVSGAIVYKAKGYLRNLHN
jgi:hypothetical protein